MNILESIKIALTGLRLNLMRTILTMLGIIIGIGSVITIFTVSDAIEKSVTDTFEQFGTETMLLYVDTNVDEGYDRGDMYIGASNPNMSIEMINDVKNVFADKLQAVSLDGPSESGTIPNGKDSLDIQVSSVTPGYGIIQQIEMVSGRFINEEDNERLRKVIVVSASYADKMYGGDVNAPLGEELVVDTYKGVQTYTIVGVIKKKDEEPGGMVDISMMFDDDRVKGYTPYMTSTTLNNPDDLDDISSFEALPKRGLDPTAVAEEVAQYIKNTYYSDKPAITISHYTMKEMLDNISDTFSILRIGLGSIAALSLLVGGIGVMNILLVSVTERTREIGIRKALGATTRDIRLQFLIESIIVTIFGGMIGVLLGGALGYAASNFMMGSGMLPSILSIVVAVGFSVVIGVFFGFYPANKASKLNPIDALRYE